MQFLDEVPSDSDISGCEDDSGDDETWLPREDRNVVSSDDDDNDLRDLAGAGDGGGDGQDQLLQDPECLQNVFRMSSECLTRLSYVRDCPGFRLPLIKNPKHPY